MVGTELFNLLKTLNGIKVSPTTVLEQKHSVPYLVYNLDACRPEYFKGVQKTNAEYKYTLSIYSDKYTVVEGYNDLIYSLLVTYEGAAIKLIRVDNSIDAGYNEDYKMFQRDVSVTIIGTIGVQL